MVVYFCSIDKQKQPIKWYQLLYYCCLKKNFEVFFFCMLSAVLFFRDENIHAIWKAFQSENFRAKVWNKSILKWNIRSWYSSSKNDKVLEFISLREGFFNTNLNVSIDFQQINEVFYTCLLDWSQNRNQKFKLNLQQIDK